jgi:hypothetical protein
MEPVTTWTLSYLQLQRQRCSRLERLYFVEKIIVKTRYDISGYYNAGVVTRDRRIGTVLNLKNMFFTFVHMFE